MATKKKTGMLAGAAVAGLAAAGIIALGGPAFAETTSTTTAPAATTTQTGAPADQAGRHQRGPGGASQDTPVTGDEATKVGDAVKAQNPDVTIDSVRQDPDGSYDALGTKSDGTQVMYDVSIDLQTITENAGGKGGPGGASQDTPVTGDEATKVGDAVKAQNPDVTIDSVRQDPDGSYDALGTKSDGTQVMYDVSTDLQTITENAGR